MLIKSSDPKGKRSMEVPRAMREALVSMIHKIDTGILTGCAEMYFNQLFSLRFEKESSIMMWEIQKNI